MPKQPSKPGIPIPSTEETEAGTGRHRTCAVGRAAIVKTEQLTQRLEDHIEDDDDKLGALSRDVEQVDRKVDTLGDRVGDLRVEVATMTVAVGGISKTLAEQNELKHVRVVAEVNAEVETGKVEKITKITSEADRKKEWRSFWLKVALAAIAALGAAAGAIIEHYR